MLAVLVSGEEQISTEQFDSYAADRPYVCEFIPFTAFEDDFRRAILSGADDGAVRFVEKRGSSKVDDSNFIVFG